MVALSAACDELAAGNHVIYLDFEDSEGGIAGRCSRWASIAPPWPIASTTCGRRTHCAAFTSMT